MVVEDDAVLRLAIRRILAVQNEVTEVTGCDEARRTLRAASPYDVVLLDLGLSDGDGASLLDPIRAGSPQAAVIVMTGRDDIRLALRCIANGAHDFVVKSAELVSDLLARIPFAQAQARARARSEALRNHPSCTLPATVGEITPEHFSRYRDTAEREYIAAALRLCGDSSAEAATRLGLGRSTLFKRIVDLGVRQSAGGLA